MVQEVSTEEFKNKMALPRCTETYGHSRQKKTWYVYWTECFWMKVDIQYKPAWEKCIFSNKTRISMRVYNVHDSLQA